MNQPTLENYVDLEAGVSDSTILLRRRQLERDRNSYEQLIHTLQTLPEKTRHRAFIPIAPGLFGHGELIHTNEVLVLLGSAGKTIKNDLSHNNSGQTDRNYEESFFVERSAKQAQGIAQRRIHQIDVDLASLSNQLNIGNRDTEIVSSVKPHSQVNSSQESPSRSTSSNKKANSSKKVRFADDVQETTVNSLRNKNRPTSILRQPLSEAKDESESRYKKDQLTQLADHFKSALENAQRATDQHGIVHLTEFYDSEEADRSIDDHPEPKTVEMSGIQGVHNDGVDFGEDSNEYLDISSGHNEALPDWEHRKALLDELAEAEDALCEAEPTFESNGDTKVDEVLGARDDQVVQLQEPKPKLQSKDDFGSGFARGFFNSKKQPERVQPKNPNATTSAVVSKTDDRLAENNVEKSEVPAVSVPAVSSNVVTERATGSAGHRRRRRTRKVSTQDIQPRIEVSAENMKQTLTDDNTEMAEDGLGESEDGRQRTSRFMQMRRAQKGRACHNRQ